MNYNMHKLERHQILGGDGKTMVWVYDGDVEYQLTETSKNPKYYYDKFGIRYKTRPYCQWTSMIARSTKGSAYQKVYPAYRGVTRSKMFDNFDSWVEWAQGQPFFMCLYEGYLCQLDKDLKGSGEYYSENTCCFLPTFINSGLKGNMDVDRVKSFLYQDECFELIDDKLMEILLSVIENSETYVNPEKVLYNIYSLEGLKALGDAGRDIINASSIDILLEITDSVVKVGGRSWECSVNIGNTTINGVGDSKIKAQKDFLSNFKKYLADKYKKVNIDNNFGEKFTEFFNEVYLNVCKLEKYL